MNPSPPQVGLSYLSRLDPFLASSGIPEGVEYAVINTDGDKVSMALTFSHGRQAPSKITIAKVFFGQSFELKKGFYQANASYASGKHYYPVVDPHALPIFHSLIGKI